MHEEQDPGQVLQGASGNSETLTASGVLSLETSSADSQVSPPFARKFRPALEFVPEDGDFCVCVLDLGEKRQKRLRTYGNVFHIHTLQLTNLL